MENQYNLIKKWFEQAFLGSIDPEFVTWLKTENDLKDSKIYEFNRAYWISTLASMSELSFPYYQDDRDGNPIMSAKKENKVLRLIQLDRSEADYPITCWSETTMEDLNELVICFYFDVEIAIKIKEIITGWFFENWNINQIETFLIKQNG